MNVELPKNLEEAKKPEVGDLIRVHGSMNYLVIKRKNEVALVRLENMEIAYDFEEELTDLGKNFTLIPHSRLTLKVD